MITQKRGRYSIYAPNLFGSGGNNKKDALNANFQVQNTRTDFTISRNSIISVPGVTLTLSIIDLSYNITEELNTILTNLIEVKDDVSFSNMASESENYRFFKNTYSPISFHEDTSLNSYLPIPTSVRSGDVIPRAGPGYIWTSYLAFAGFLSSYGYAVSGGVLGKGVWVEDSSNNEQAKEAFKSGSRDLEPRSDISFSNSSTPFDISYGILIATTGPDSNKPIAFGRFIGNFYSSLASYIDIRNRAIEIDAYVPPGT